MSETPSSGSLAESSQLSRRFILKSGLAVVAGSALALGNVDSPLIRSANTWVTTAPALLRFGRSSDVQMRQELEILTELHQDSRHEMADRIGKKPPVKSWELFRPKTAQAAEEWIYSPFVPWTNDPEYFPFQKNGKLIDLQAGDGPLAKFCQTYTLVTGRECGAFQYAQNFASNQLEKYRNYPSAEIESIGKCHAKAAAGLLEYQPTFEVTTITKIGTDGSVETVEIGYKDRYGILGERHSGDLFFRPYTQDELKAGALNVGEDGNYVFEANGRDLFDRFAQYFFNADLENDPGARFEVNAPPTIGAGRWWRAVYGISQDSNQFAGTSFTRNFPEIFQTSQVQFAQSPVFPDQASKLPKSMRDKLIRETEKWRNPYLLNNPEDRFEDFSLYLVYDPERLMEFAEKYGQSITIETH